MIGPHWTSPGVECHTCGRTVTPVATMPNQTLGQLFWAMPAHRAFSGFAPGLCGGSNRLLGPVT